MNRGQLVSVIITTKNEEDIIARLINSIIRQTYKNREIILVDNNSTDRTVNIAKRMKIKVYIFGPERSAQRNYGAKMAKGRYLIFLDADMELSKDVIKECVDLIEKDKRIGGIAIPEESIAKNFWEKVKAFERSFYNLQGDDITDAARFFSRKAFLKVGGYDTNITGPEDWDLRKNILKSGYQIARIKALIFHHERVTSLIDLIKKKYYYGLRSYRYLSKHKIGLANPETIYFLRPVFYKNFHNLLKHPILSLGMLVMLTAELIGGGLGYLVGRIKKL